MFDIYLWFARTDVSVKRQTELEACLSAQERTRAAAFRFDRDRNRFIAAHGFLRCVLGQHLNTAPARVSIWAEPGRKPQLDGVVHHDRFGFSLSRSGGMALCGVVQGRQLGVDLEQTRPLPELESLAATVLSHRELAQWSSLPEAVKLQRFYSAWTRKEAIGKAGGEGVFTGPQTIEVPMQSLGPSRWLSVDDRKTSSRWILSTVVPAEGAMGCVAVQWLDDDSFTDHYEDTLIEPTGSGESRSHQDARFHIPPDCGLIIRRFSDV